MPLEGIKNNKSPVRRHFYETILRDDFSTKNPSRLRSLSYGGHCSTSGLGKKSN